MTIHDSIPDNAKVLIATTTGASAATLLRRRPIDALVFHQNTVLSGRRVELDPGLETELRDRSSGLFAIPPGYSRSLLSKAYREAMQAASPGTKVCFEMLLYALERRVIKKGDVVYGVAGTQRGSDTLIRFVVPTLDQFHQGGYQDFEFLGSDVNGALPRLREVLTGKNQYLPVVLLYHPKAYPDRDYAWTPFSVLSIASIVPPDEYYPYIIDNNSDCADSHRQELLAIGYKLRLVGVSSMIGHQIRDMLSFLREVRGIRPDVPVVVGGALPTILGELTLSHDLVDFVVRSQGELTFLELLGALESPADWPKILGLGYKHGGMAKLNALRPIHKKSAFPAYPFGLIDLSRYIRPAGSVGQRVLSYISSQGCPFKCAFCSDMLIYQHKWTSRHEDQIIHDLRFFRDAFDVDGVKFYDSNLLVSQSRVEKFCGSIAEANLGLKYATSIHPRVMAGLSPDAMDLLRASGCKRLLIGTESGNEHELIMIRKGATVADMVECARRLRQLEIVGTFTLIIGLPGSTVDSLRESVALGRQIADIWPAHEVKMQVYQPYPGTELYDRFKVPGAYEPATLEEWSLEAFDTTPTPHREFNEYLQKVRRRHPELFSDEEKEMANA